MHILYLGLKIGEKNRFLKKLTVLWKICFHDPSSCQKSAGAKQQICKLTAGNGGQKICWYS